MMITRNLGQNILEGLSQSPVVALYGPRQVGKTTLARQLLRDQPHQFFDLENPVDQLKLTDLYGTLHHFQDQLVIIDEAQRNPELFPILRVLVDEKRTPGRFLLLGSSTPSLKRQNAESLAGRLFGYELTPLLLNEWAPKDLQTLWMRGGFPLSTLANSNPHSYRWRRHYLDTLLDRDFVHLGQTKTPSSFSKLCTMLAHCHGQMLNLSSLSKSLDLSFATLSHYLDTLEQLFFIRRLTPYYSNIGKRLSKSPKLYIRDSGLLHVLLGIESMDPLITHPSFGFSWEGFVIEQVTAILPESMTAGFWRTFSGAEIDLVLLKAGKPCIGIEIKSGSSPKPKKGFKTGCADLNLSEKWVVYPGTDSYTLPDNVQVLPLSEALSRLTKFRKT